MSEETAVAESSSASVVENLEIPRSGTPDYAEWRVSGKLPDPKPKTEETASSDTLTEETADAGEATAPQKKQEKRRPDAESRIAELIAENKRLKAEREAKPAEAAKPEPKAEKAQQYTRPRPTPEDKNSDGTPKYATYEDFSEELADWKYEQRRTSEQREQQQQAQTKEVQAKVKEAEARYPNFKEIAIPTVDAIVKNQDIPPVVKQMLNDSEVWTDLIFTLGGDPDALADFVEMAKTAPGKAIRYIANVEREIALELDKGTTEATTAGRDASGKFAKAEATPVKRGPESAAEPPLEIGNRGTGSMDEAARALSDIERGNPNAVRAWMKAENAKDLRRRRGV